VSDRYWQRTILRIPFSPTDDDTQTFFLAFGVQTIHQATLPANRLALYNQRYQYTDRRSHLSVPLNGCDTIVQKGHEFVHPKKTFLVGNFGVPPPNESE